MLDISEGVVFLCMCVSGTTTMKLKLQLYSSKDYIDEFKDDLLSDKSKQISLNEYELCDKDITMQECFSAVNKRKSNKSQGSD